MDDSWEEWDGVIPIDDDNNLNDDNTYVDTNEFQYQYPYGNQSYHIYTEPSKKPLRILKRNPLNQDVNTPKCEDIKSNYEDINLESKYNEKSKSYEELKKKIFEDSS